MRKTLKRFLIMVLCCFYFVSTIQVMAQSSQSDAYAHEISILRNLGIVDGETESQSAVVRSMLFDAVARISSNNTYDTNKEAVVFADIPTDYEYYKAIRYLYENNLIKGNSKSSINPDGVVTSADIAVLMLRLLGFETIATLKGGYPIGYLDVANSVGLFKGIKFNSAQQLNFGEMSKVLYNALEIETYTVSSAKGEDIEYSPSGKYLLEVCMNMQVIDGIVTSNSITSISETQTVKNKVSIESDGEVFFLNDQANISEKFLGRHVLAYAELVDDTEYLLKAMFEDDNISIKIDTKDILDYSKNMLKYATEDGDTEILSISPKSGATKNGVSIEGVTYEQLKPKKGFVVLVDNDDDEVYDYVEITEYIDMVVGNVSVEGESIFDAFDTSLVLRLEETDYVIYKGQEKIALEALKKNNILSVAKAQQKDGDYLYRIYLSDNVVTGELEETNNGDKTLKVNNTSYDVLFDNSEEYLNSLRIGEQYKFYVNFENYIVQSSLAKETTNLAYIIAAAKKKGVAGNIEIKLFDSLGKISIIETAKKVNIDGYPFSSPDEIYIKLAGGLTNKVKPRLIKFSVNSDNQINVIETEAPNAKLPAEEYKDDFELSLDFNVEQKYYGSRSRSFGGEFLMDNSTVVFSIPKDLSQEKAFRIKTISEFVDSEKYDAKVYNVDKDSGLAKYVVTSVDATSISFQVKLSVFDKMTTIINNDGIESKKLYFHGDTGLVSGILSNDAQQYVYDIVNDMEKGDVVRYTIDSAVAEIVHVERVFKVSQAAKITSLGMLPSSSSATALRPYDYNYTYTGAYIYKPAISYGVPLNIKDNIIYMQFAQKTENDYLKHLLLGEAEPKLSRFYYSAKTPTQIQLVTMSESGEITIKQVQDFSELKTVKSTGDYFDASRVLMKVYDGIVQDVIIYNFPISKNKTILQ